MIDIVSRLLSYFGELLLPFILGSLLLLSLWTLEQTGEYLVEGIRRWKNRRKLADAIERGFDFNKVHASKQTLLGKYLHLYRTSTQSELEGFAEGLDLEASQRLSKLMLGIRMGPMLGLMGTLIPLGPALLSLEPGKFTVFSQWLTIAFGKTVVGLFVSGVCYLLAYYRKAWDLEDLRIIDKHLDFIAQSNEADATDLRHPENVASRPALEIVS